MAEARSSHLSLLATMGGVAVLASLGCAKLSVGSSITTTTREPGTRRVWAVSMLGELTVYTATALPQAPGQSTGPRWDTVPVPPLAIASDVASWPTAFVAGETYAETVFAITDTSKLLRISVSPNVSWTEMPKGPLSGGFVRSIATTVPIGGAPTVAALFQHAGGSVSLVEYQGGSQTVWPAFQPALAFGVPTARIAATNMGADSCYFVRTEQGQVARFMKSSFTPSTTAPPGGVTGALAAASWVSGGSPLASVFAIGGGQVWQGTMSSQTPQANCGGSVVWTPMGAPGPLSVGESQLAATAYVGVSKVEVVVATFGDLWSNVSTGGVWSGWLLKSHGPDSVGQTGISDLGAVVVAPPSSGMGPSTFFVMRDREWTGFLAESTATSNPDYHMTAGSHAVNVNVCQPAFCLFDCANACPAWQTLPWTEAMLDARPGITAVGAVILDDVKGNEAQRIGLAVSGDGYHWAHTRIAPVLVAQGSKQTVMQGDPQVQIEPDGTVWIMFHELLRAVNPNETSSAVGPCDIGHVTTLRSKIRLFRSIGGQLVEFSSAFGSDWDLVTTPAEGFYLDHPQLRITDDGTFHYSWLVTGAVGGPRVEYRTGPPWSPNPTTTIATKKRNAEDTTGPPYMVVNGSSVYVGWFQNGSFQGPGGGLALPLWLWTPGQGLLALSSNVGGVCAPAEESQMGDGPLFTNGTVGLRAGLFAVHVSPSEPAHVMTAVVSTGATSAASCVASKSLQSPSDIVFGESRESGGQGTWTHQVLTEGQPALLRFGPEVVSDGKGTVFVTYWEGPALGFLVTERVAVRQAGETFFSFYDRGTMDVRNGPLKCGDNDNTQPSSDHHVRFFGDYHVGRGWNGYVTTLRTGFEGGRFVLQMGQMSSTSWR